MKIRKIFQVVCLAVAIVCGNEVVMAQTEPANDYVPTIIAGVRKADSWTMDNTKEGIYRLELKEGSELELLKEGKPLAPLGGAVYVDGKMDGINYTAVEDYGGMSYVVSHVQYDMETWNSNYFQYLSDLDRNFISSCGLAHDPTTGKNYGIFFNFNLDWQVVDRKFGTIDFTEKQPTKEVIALATTPMVTIACNTEGQLYAIGQDGILYTINKATGNVMPVGSTGIEYISTYPMSMTFDPKTGKLYWNVIDQAMKAAIYEVSTATGAATKVMDTPDNAFLVNMYIAAPEAEDEAPAAVTNLKATFNDEAVKGIISFTMPTTTYRGQALSGSLNYRITADGNEVANGNANVGAEVEADVKLNYGTNEVVVVASNEAGDSPEASIAVFVGPEQPLAPTDVNYTYDFDNKTVTLGWTAPTVGTHGKELQADNLTYIIERVDNNTVISEQATGESLSFSFEPAALGAYTFRVAAVNKKIAKSDYAVSNKAVVGPAKDVPYSTGFANKEGMDIFTTIDANGDGKTWEWGKSLDGNGRAEYFVNKEKAADDWLITPPIYLLAGAEYELSFDALTAYVNCADYLHVAYGQGFDPNNYTNLFEKLILNEPQTQNYVRNGIIVEESGAYYFGFHATSPTQYGGMIILDNIWVTLVNDNNSIKNTELSQTVKTVAGGVEISNAEGKNVEIYTADGRLITKKAGSNHMIKPLANGVYIVRVGKTAVRVTVK